MLFLGALLLPLLSSCLSEVVWDPTDPRCEQRRKEPNVREHWDNYVMGQAYSWIDRYGHTKVVPTPNYRKCYLVNRYLHHAMGKLFTIESVLLAYI